MLHYRRKYGVLTVTGTTAIRFPMITYGTTDLESGSVWTPAAGDVKIGKDGGALANVTNLPTYVNGAWDLVLTATELQCANAIIRLIDQTNPKVIEDQFLYIETFGHASAMEPTDYTAALATAAAVDAVDNFVDTEIAYLRKLQANKQVIDTNANTMTIYDDDGTTPLLVFNLTGSATAGYTAREPD